MAANTQKNFWQWWMRRGDHAPDVGMTLGRWVGLAAVLFGLFLLGHFVTVKFAILMAALLVMTGLVVFEMTTRRRWEENMTDELARMNTDYGRVVREIARNRNEIAGLKKKLADAAVAVREVGREFSDEPVEQRMIKAILEQMSSMDGRSLGAETGMLPKLDNLPEFKVEKGKTLDEREVAKKLTDEQVLQLVSHSVGHDTVDLFMQPIVALPQRKARFFELFSRIRIQPGVHLPAERYINVALKAGLLHVIDNLLLLRALQLVRHAAGDDTNRAFFINVSPATLNDPKFMGDLVEFIAQNRLLAPRLVFELGQSDLKEMSEDVLPVLEGLAKLGCRFSMDQVRRLNFDFAHLEARYIRFIKVDAPFLMRELGEDDGLAKLKRLKTALDRRGIDLIVEKIEREKQIAELMDVEIDYGQGYLFGKPELSAAG